MRIFGGEWRKVATVLPLALAFASGILTLTYAAIHMRVLYRDGGNVLYHILTGGTFFRNRALYRFIAYLPQVPAMLTIHLFGFDEMQLTREILAFSYSWLPIFGILSAVGLSFFYKKQMAALGPLLTFGFVSLPIAGLAVSVSAESVSLFWIAYMIQVYGRRTTKENIALFLICVPLAFGHETALILAALLLVLALLQKYRFAALLQLLTLGGYVLRIIDLRRSNIDNVVSQNWQNLDPFAVTTTISLVAILIATGIARFQSPSRKILSFWAGAVVATSTFFYFVSTDALAGLDGVYQTYTWRMYATFFLTLIAATMWILDTRIVSVIREKYNAPYSTHWWRFLYAAAIAGMLNGALLDYRGTKIWQSEVEILKEFVNAQPESCVEIPWKVYDEMKIGQIQAYNTAHTWAMLQEDGIVEKFVFVGFDTDTLYGPAKDICRHLHDDPSEIDPGFSKYYSAPIFTVNHAAFTYTFLQSNQEDSGSSD